MEKIEDISQFNNFIDLIDELIYLKDKDGRYINCNKTYCEYFNLEKNQIIGKTDFDLFNHKHAKILTQNDKSIFKEKKKKELIEVLIFENQETIQFKSTKQLIEYNGEDVLFGQSKDVTALKEYKILYNTNQKVLEKIIDLNPLDEILEFIIEEADKINEDMICSIVLLDETSKHVEKTIAKKLPDFYNKALIGLEIADEIGSCGTAAYRKERVVVDDISTHPYWQNYTELTSKLDVKACWSQPIFAEGNKVLGTFAIYYKEIKKPSTFELEFIESFTNIISIAINRTKRIEKIKQKENLLIQSSKMATLGEMLENIAHQWRQPLSVITTLASALRLKSDYEQYNKEEYITSLKQILNTTSYLSNTIEDFRNYFLVNKEKKEVNVFDVVDKSLNILEAKYKASNINFIINGDETAIKTYENELIHIFINIFNNSKDAFEKNKNQEKFIFVNVNKNKNICNISIKDNANGAKEEIINKIFEPYFTTKHQHQGTGIGLYMVQDILKRHLHGSIQAQNKSFFYKGKNFKGLEFNITLPIK